MNQHNSRHIRCGECRIDQTLCSNKRHFLLMHPGLEPHYLEPENDDFIKPTVGYKGIRKTDGNLQTNAVKKLRNSTKTQGKWTPLQELIQDDQANKYLRNASQPGRRTSENTRRMAILALNYMDSYKMSEEQFEIENGEMAYTCQICRFDDRLVDESWLFLDREFKSCVPEGHRLCSECKERIRPSDMCPFDRKRGAFMAHSSQFQIKLSFHYCKPFSAKKL